MEFQSAKKTTPRNFTEVGNRATVRLSFQGRMGKAYKVHRMTKFTTQLQNLQWLAWLYTDISELPTLRVLEVEVRLREPPLELLSVVLMVVLELTDVMEPLPGLEASRLTSSNILSSSSL